MNRFGNLLFKVFFIFFLGVAFISIPAYIFDLIANTKMFEYLFSNKPLFGNYFGVSLFDFIGIFSIALAIWDGQFVNNVKPNHWSIKSKGN